MNATIKQHLVDAAAALVRAEDDMAYAALVLTDPERWGSLHWVDQGDRFTFDSRVFTFYPRVMACALAPHNGGGDA